MTACSLMLKGPGFRSIEEPPSQRGSCRIRRGRPQAMRRPKGYATSLVWVPDVSLKGRIIKIDFTYSPARGSNVGPGPRREKNVLIAAPAIAKKRPMTIDRMVKAMFERRRQSGVVKTVRRIIADLAFLGHPCSIPKPEPRDIGCPRQDPRLRR
jgi:hypothetical protein